MKGDPIMALKIPTVESSPLLRRIRNTLESLALDHCTLRVSVADTAQWEKSAAGDEVLVRWLCWSVESNGQELIRSEFEVVGKDVTRERLAEELPHIFPDVEVSVDNDIEV